MSQTAGQVRLLVDDGRKDGRTVTDERTASACKGLNVKRTYQGATVRAIWTGIGEVRDWIDGSTRRTNRTVGER